MGSSSPRGRPGTPRALERRPAAAWWAAAGLSPSGEPGHARRSPQQAELARARGCGQRAQGSLRVSLSCRPPRTSRLHGTGQLLRSVCLFSGKGEWGGAEMGTYLKLDNKQHPGFSSDLISVHVEASSPRSVAVPSGASHHCVCLSCPLPETPAGVGGGVPVVSMRDSPPPAF